MLLFDWLWCICWRWMWIEEFFDDDDGRRIFGGEGSWGIWMDGWMINCLLYLSSSQHMGGTKRGVAWGTYRTICVLCAWDLSFNLLFTAHFQQAAAGTAAAQEQNSLSQSSYFAPACHDFKTWISIIDQPACIFVTGYTECPAVRLLCFLFGSIHYFYFYIYYTSFSAGLTTFSLSFGGSSHCSRKFT